MSLWRQFARGTRALLHRSRVDQEERDEVRHYLEQAAAAHRAAGLSPGAAARAARIELGGAVQVAEQVREYGWETWVENLWADLRFAARRLRGEPGFTLVTVLTLAIGLGASTAIFSAVNPILFQPLPYPEPRQVVSVWDFGVDRAPAEVTYGTYHELIARTRSFAAFSVFKPWQPTLTGGAEPERIDGQRVTWEYFRVLGVGPVLGQGFQESDDRPGSANVVILSDGLWRRRFDADPAIIGRRITFGDDPFTVVGVMPKGFENVLSPEAELWTPLHYDLSQGRAWGHHLRMVARLKPGVSLAGGGRELDQIAGDPVPEFPRMPWASLKSGLAVQSLQADLTRGVKPALLAVIGAVVLLLIIACVNVTNLLLARGVRRRGEFAVRAALGAGRGRLVRQLLAEHLLLALISGVLGLGIAVLGVRALIALSPPALPRLEAIRVDGTLFVFALGITLLTGLVFGSVVAIQASGEAPQGTLHLASRRSAGGHRRARALLVVTQVALALVLLVSSGLLLRSLQRIFAVDAGFDPSNLLTLQVQTSGQRYSSDSTTYRFFAEALDAVRRVPGVTAAGLTSQLPLSGDLNLYGARFYPQPADDPGETRGTFLYAVSPGYFEAMGIPLKRGRLLDEGDRAGAAPVAVISEAMAGIRLPGLDPIGQQLRIGGDWPYTVVGVVGDVRQVSLALEEANAVYTTGLQWRFAERLMSMVIRTRGNPADLAPAVRNAIWSVDKDQAVVRVATMDGLIARTAAERRFTLILFEAFALVALILAAAGIYGVLSGSVAERTREIGVRAALGASRESILGLILGQGMSLTGLGVVFGLVGAGLATRFITVMLFGVSPLDPLTWLSVISLLALVAALACLVPAWRAARVDPVSTLRSE